MTGSGLERKPEKNGADGEMKTKMEGGRKGEKDGGGREKRRRSLEKEAK